MVIKKGIKIFMICCICIVIGIIIGSESKRLIKSDDFSSKDMIENYFKEITHYISK